ncbi:MAG: ATP-binding cassette domain-containing protein, partial [Luteitalea sp.]|nr:ATP-binding cassette domain-containing protein [Luteitalea sp.]
DRQVVREFSTRIMRGDRIGLIGPNGAGKTTLLRLLLGDLAPDGGGVRAGANVQVAYYDQQREQLDPERTVFDTVGEGSDTVTVNGESRHVHGYLRDFLFPAERARSPVKALSGGERNRLLLARLFTRPANVLVLDEPTNDLDIETLELLEAQLVEWPGTLLLVTHDRVFLDNVVSSTMVFEGDGHVAEYVGGYVDWQRQRHAGRRSDSGADPARTSGTALASAAITGQRARETVAVRETAESERAPHAAPPARKLSYKERRELDTIPRRIEALETEQNRLQAAVAAPGFYKEPADQIARALDRIADIERELLDAYARWDELDART